MPVERYYAYQDISGFNTLIGCFIHPNCRLLYGSKEIVKEPEVRKSKYNKDFYFGFYCTLIEEQAFRWAVRMDGKGIINEYEYNKNKDLKILKFDEMTEEWLDFIVACRNGKNMHMILLKVQWQMTKYIIILVGK